MVRCSVVYTAGAVTWAQADCFGDATQAAASACLHRHFTTRTWHCVVQVIALVQRCLSAPVAPPVKSIAQHMLQRWKWQLDGHMQVRADPYSAHTLNPLIIMWGG